MTLRTIPRRRRAERARMARIARHLRRRPLTIYELMALEGIDRTRTWRFLSYLRGEREGPRRVRIVEWRRETIGPPVAVYGRGTGPDLPAPPRMSHEEYRQRKNASRRRGHVAVAMERRASRVKVAPVEASVRRMHPRHDGDDIEASFDTLMAFRADSIQPRRDAMIAALFGAAP